VINCGISNAGSVLCRHKNILKRTGANTVNQVGERVCAATNCGMVEYRNYIEVHISSHVMAVANASDFQVVVPITIPTTSTINSTTIKLGIGVATSHSGAYGDYNQILEYKEITLTKPGAFASSALSGLEIASGTVNTNQFLSTADLLFKLNTISPARVGSYYTSSIDTDCNPGTNDCNLTSPGEYWSWTICADWNFMKSSKFQVANAGKLIAGTADAYLDCVTNMTIYGGGFGMRYCLWCPMWVDGATDSNLIVTEWYIPDDAGLKWPANTISAFSGFNVGLKKWADLQHMSADSFVANEVTLVTVEPVT
jgi:hypothetical protein